MNGMEPRALMRTDALGKTKVLGGFLGCVGLALFLCSCRGPVGPMGPSGSGSPVYLFNQDFDGYTSGTGYTGNQFVVDNPNEAEIGLYVTSSLFVSAPNSLFVDWYANPGDGAGFYTASGVWSLPANTDCIFDVYVNASALTTDGEEAEVVLNLNNNTVATLGFNSTSASNASVYTYNNGTAYTLASGVSTSYFHHVVLDWSHSTGLSSVSLDGNLLGQNLTGTRALPSGAPGTSCGVSFPLGMSTAQNGVYLDNVEVYHY